MLKASSAYAISNTCISKEPNTRIRICLKNDKFTKNFPTPIIFRLKQYCREKAAYKFERVKRYFIFSNTFASAYFHSSRKSVP